MSDRLKMGWAKPANGPWHWSDYGQALCGLRIVGRMPGPTRDESDPPLSLESCEHCRALVDMAGSQPVHHHDWRASRTGLCRCGLAKTEAGTP